MAVVYQHRRKDTNEVFYIGIGRNKKRAFLKTHRNNHWHNIVNKVGYEIDVLIEGCSWEDACDVEAGMIESYGRHDIGLGQLANQTNGGDGGFGIIVKDITKEKIRQYQLSLNKKGKPGRVQTQEVKDKIQNTLKGRPRPIEVIEKLKRPKINKGNYSHPKDKITCPHCGKDAQPALAYRWHFDNCKNKK